MPPAVLVDLDPDAFRQPRRCAFGRDIADRAGRASAAAGARVAASPWSFRMAGTVAGLSLPLRLV
jgi:hypothetical protein